LAVLALVIGIALALPTIAAAATNKDAVAVIIGNKNYAGSVPDVDFAHNDAAAMKRYIVAMMGVREGNIIDLRDATQAQMESTLGNTRSHQGKLWRWVKSGKSDVILYYSGHGVPSLKDGRSFLLPSDADPDTPEINGYPLETLYANLLKLRARSVTVYLDACFSGETPKGMIIESFSAIGVSVKLPSNAPGLAVLTAASGNQVASWDEEAKHGLFTRYLLQGLRGKADSDGNGEVTLAEVKRYLDEEMTYEARRRFGRDQHATSLGGDSAVLALLPKTRSPQSGVISVAEVDLNMKALKNANVRAGPDTAFSKIGVFRKGAQVAVTGEARGRDWFRVAMADGEVGYVWRPLLGEEGRAAKKSPADAPPPPPSSEPGEIIIAEGPLRGLTLTDWLLLSVERLRGGEYVPLIDEAADLRARYGPNAEVDAVLHKAVMGDLAAREGMARVVYAAGYVRQIGAFPALKNMLDDAVRDALLSFEPVTKTNARKAIAAVSKIKAVTGATPVALALEARAYHIVEEYEKAEAAYAAWLDAAPPEDAKRKHIIAAMLRARQRKILDPGEGKEFRDCPECPKMIVLPAGEFMMGSPESEKGRRDNEGPLHRVTIRRPFAIGKFEVTFAEWDACVTGGGCNAYMPRDEAWGRDDRPVINVNYADANAYTAWLSRKTGQAYRLPSEAEWEYAVRAGTATRYPIGDTISPSEVNFKGKRTMPVGSYAPNGFGLYDMLGNVWEWTGDCWNQSYANAPVNGESWAEGDCGLKVLRGGSWINYPWNTRSASRLWLENEVRKLSFGMRVVRNMP